MRTTVRLGEALLTKAKQEARKRGETLTSLMERGLRLAISGSHKRVRSGRVKVPVRRPRAVSGRVSISMTRAPSSIALTASDDPAGRQRPHLRLPAGLGPACGVSCLAAGGGRWSERLRRLAAGTRRRAPNLYAPEIYRQPSTLTETLAFCETLLEPVHSTLILPGERHWSIFADLCESSEVSGNLVQDAWFAALAIEHGCEWISTDSDYDQFRALRWHRPFESSRRQPPAVVELLPPIGSVGWRRGAGLLPAWSTPDQRPACFPW